MAHVLVIDGDVPCYLACKTRRPKKNGFYQILKKGEEDTWVFSAEEDEVYLEECWQNLQELIVNMKHQAKAEFFLMAVKSDTNYRDLIFPPVWNNGDPYGYKANRIFKKLTSKAKDTGKATVAPFVKKMRQMSIDAGFAIEAHEREADDLVRIWATEATANGDTYTIASIDKDLGCIPGKHLKIKDQVIITITPQYATRFYYQQLLSGDPTDNIPGLPGIAGIKAEKMLEQYDTEQEFQAVVIEAYKAYFPKDWRNTLLANGKLIHIQKHVNDWFNIRGWAQFAE